LTRGRVSTIGATRVSPNGYHYTRTEKGWVTTHTIVAEERLGRPLEKNERVKFKDGDRTNLSPDNLIVYIVQERSKNRKIAQLKARIADLQAQLEELEDE